jgi:hypothetical protein
VESKAEGIETMTKWLMIAMMSAALMGLSGCCGTCGGGAKVEKKACAKCEGPCKCPAKKACTKCEGECKCPAKKACTKCEGECKCPKK